MDRDGEGPGQIYRMLGRIEQKVDGLAEGGTHRDEALADLTERVRQNRHEANGHAGRLGLQVEGLTQTGKRLEATVTSLSGRVQALETPVRRAMQARAGRRRLWVKVVSVASAVGVLMWAVFEPLYKVGVEMLAKRWLG